MSALRIDVSDLLAHAGARRPLALAVPVDDLAVSALQVTEPLALDLVLERVPEGIVVRGTIHAHWEGECSVCLRELAADVDVAVSDLFEAYPVDGETYPLEGHQIDLEQLVRDTVLLDLPLVPTCESVGLAPCAPHVELLGNDPVAQSDGPSGDPRWAALSELEL
jgi:uncharacterized protein